MHRVLRKVAAVVVLAASTMLLVWGWRGFARVEPIAPLPDGPQMRMCPPTIGELAEEFGIGIAMRQIGCLAVGLAGLLVASGSALYLIPKQQVQR